jgi:hypothetical protein
MKHLKNFEGYVFDEERNINDILDKMNKGDKLSDDDTLTLKNQGKIPDWKDKLKYSLDNRFLKDESPYPFSDLIGIELLPEDLESVINDIIENKINFSVIMKFAAEHPEIKEQEELREIWETKLGPFINKD